MGIFSFFRRSDRTNVKVNQISAEQLKQVMQSPRDKIFIDVRTKDEFKANHIRNFNNIPLANLPNHLSKLDKQKEIYVICQSGGRSSSACSLLKKEGFKKIYNVMGGMSAWDRIKNSK
ncbi:rhodanese-like domain-containing protein [Ferviditalea candida]|uniref:Rhodanese-like domain-containing protein n=1 Tax=Ferviditalea candida TaxID=3108399 RepID=A0ABU5ZI99_9BACL|nr:rhodanese-like domain-containing protein [Paenibacillaceae bacterium T2]